MRKSIENTAIFVGSDIIRWVDTNLEGIIVVEGVGLVVYGVLDRCGGRNIPGLTSLLGKGRGFNGNVDIVEAAVVSVAVGVRVPTEDMMSNASVACIQEV